MECVEREPCPADLCIGQLVPFWQHSIRASAVASQPPHTARFPTQSVRTAAIAASRRLKVTTYVGCWSLQTLSNQTGSRLLHRSFADFVTLHDGCSDRSFDQTASTKRP